MRCAPGIWGVVCSALLISAACGGPDEDPPAPVDAPYLDAPDDDLIDAPDLDAPAIDASVIDATVIDATVIDATVIDGALSDGGSGDGGGIDAPPPRFGETCQQAENIFIPGGVGTQTRSGTTEGYVNHYEPPNPGCLPYDEDGPDRVFAVAVPAMSWLDASVTPVSGFDAGIYLVGSPATLCDANPIVCLAANDEAGAGGTDAVSYFNDTSAAFTVYVVIDTTAPDGDAFQVSVTVSSPPAGDRCSNVEDIPIAGSSGFLSGTTRAAAGYRNDYEPAGASCAAAEGTDHVYRVSVPAATRLVASVRPTVSGFDPSLNLIASTASACTGSISCLAGTDAGGTDATETLVYTSTGAEEVLLMVDSYAADEDGDYVVTAYLGVPPGDTCQLAETLTLTTGAGSADADTSSSSGVVNHYTPPSACTDGASQVGNDRVYTVPVPAGLTVTAALLPVGGWDGGIYLVAAPAASCDAATIACLDGSDAAGLDGMEVVTHTNTSGAEIDVFIVVDSDDLASQGNFHLDVSVQ